MLLSKKIITALLMPLSPCFLLLFSGLFLLWFTRRQRLGKGLAALGTFLLVGASLSPVTNLLISPLEGQYAPYLPGPQAVAAKKLPATEYIVVLGGGHVSDSKLPAPAQLELPSLARLVEGIRLYRLQPGSKLLLSGGAVFDPVPESTTMQAAAIDLGVPAEDIIVETSSRDTGEQALALAPLLAGKRFLLVTSASHMPRAMLLFRGQKLNPIAAPADFQVKVRPQPHPIRFFLSSSALRVTEITVHEYLGLWWAKLTGLLPGGRLT